MCGDCLVASGLDGFDGETASSIRNDGDLQLRYLEAAGRYADAAARCGECVAAAEVAQARREGRPDPYPVYERTMTSHHEAELEALLAVLLKSFQFRPSLVWLGIPRYDDHPAVFVSGGGYREPLGVKTYYVTEPGDQDQIIDLVSRFLAGRELDQAMIEFYEAENWTTGPDGLGGSRGEEKLLRRTFLHC